ncbi:endonuclease/exonuclease/phosphatase family protein [Geobacter pelophilus]|uniref:Endonuclease/exonuclease/phosphatase family protein n=1 Tax=Geoanaerobacter pelophilus TaxID=60036 RepID=A0AAW4LAB3_9BACT|nr:endonuclease/exonuclease/phosphatase family protein [Geoanaerobacter pelophilus]MBT0666023.1 endonuclease/exonuclease/phosphatase family protein [Geoanaerobacter pelophilus]
MITIGTFNLNNLFSRFNFQGELPAEAGAGSNISYSFAPGSYRVRTYQGALVKGKELKDTQTVASRIKEMNLDILALQEVEDIDTLQQFNREHLGRMYPYQVLIEGNDTRFIDVALLSRLPVGPVTSWRHAVHPDEPSRPVFSRDLLEVEIWDQSRSRKLLRLFNTHLKSKFETASADGQADNDLRRTRQAEVIAQIVKKRMGDGTPFVICGDMNDSPGSPCLAPFVKNGGFRLVNAMANPNETHPPKKYTPPPPSKAWTHRYKETGKDAEYTLYDQIWLSYSLRTKHKESWIHRRNSLGGDGSDHDPAWVVLDL